MKPLLALPALLSLLHGCAFYVPESAQTAHGLHEAERGALADLLRPGGATRADVLCTLGVPDRVLDGGRALLWAGSSMTGRWLFVTFFYYRGHDFTLPVGSDYLLLVEFDDAGRVLRHHFRAAPWHGFGTCLPELYGAIGHDDLVPPVR